MKHLWTLSIVVAMATPLFTLISCKDDDPENAHIEVRLTDSPAPYDEVNIEILSISINAENEKNSGWQNLALLNPGIYNLLDFQNGIDTLLADQDIPAGKISQIRLLLGTHNTVVINGVVYPLNTPSAQTSGLKLNLHDELEAGISYRLWIDFDASRSIVETGSGKYQLKPVIRAYTEAAGGTLKGTVLPAEAQCTVWAILGNDSLKTYPNTNGYYQFTGLAENSLWKVIFDATAGNYADSTTSVAITKGQTTTLNMTLHQ